MSKLLFVFALLSGLSNTLSAQAVSDNVVAPGLKQQVEEALKEMDRNDNAISKDWLGLLQKSLPDNGYNPASQPTIQYVPDLCLTPPMPPQCRDICQGGKCGILQ